MDDAILECSFYVPLHRDSVLSDGKVHETDVWEWLELELYERFQGGTFAPGYFRGFYQDPDTGAKVNDESRKIIVALVESKIEDLRALLAEACILFEQICIYLSVGGRVEFVRTENRA
jgi:hypothetical protein